MKYTLKVHDAEPYAYFKQVLARIPYATTHEELVALLPFNYLQTPLTAAASV